MKKFLSKRKILIAILVLAAILRFWNLGNVPPSPSLDEASIGYNAYSVLKTGRDEFKEFPIISQRGYDDWRRSTYLFLVVPFVAALDLNVVSVRLPAVILSILTIWATYHIVLLLFSKPSGFASAVAFLTAFMLAISPWHIYISRLGHESNACLAFLVLGVLSLLKGLKNKSGILFSVIFFTLSMISYYSGQVFLPLFAVGLLIIFRRNILSILSSNRKILTVFCIFMILLIPVFWAIFSPNALVRFQGTSTFKPESHPEIFAQEVILRNRAVEKNDIIGALFYNRHLYPSKVFIEGYVSHFSPQWLFENLPDNKFKASKMGLLYLWEIPFILIGIIGFLFSHAVDGKTKKFIFLWFFLAPLPAAFATQAPHAMRSYNFLPVWQVFTAFGLAYVFYKLPKFRILTISVFILIILLSLLTFYKNYFIVFPKEQSSSFQYSFSKTVPYILSQQKNYKKIVVSNRRDLNQSYMFFLFYSKYNPVLYQKQGGSVSGGFAQSHKINGVEFRKIDWKTDYYSKDNLYIGGISDFYIGDFLDSSKPINPILEFKNLDGSVGAFAVKPKWEKNTY